MHMSASVCFVAGEFLLLIVAVMAHRNAGECGKAFCKDPNNKCRWQSYELERKGP